MQALHSRQCSCRTAFASRAKDRKYHSATSLIKSRRGPICPRSSRADNRGNLRLYLDSASVYQWEKFAPRGFLYGSALPQAAVQTIYFRQESQQELDRFSLAGITCNPLILQKDQVPQCNLKVYKILAKQVMHFQRLKPSLFP